MATLFSVPPDSKEKEKLVGGYLTLPQFGWLILGFVIGMGIFLMFYKALPILGIIIGASVFLGIGGTFAFYKKEGETFFRYLVLSKRYRNKTKHLPSIK